MADRAGVVPQLLGAVVGIVLGSALLFAVVGLLRDDGPVEPEVTAGASPSAAATPEDGEEPAPSATASPEAEDEPSPAAEPAEEGSPEPTEPSEDPAEPSEDPAEPDEDPAEPAEEVDPATVSIQVLNAAGGGQGSAAAREVADELREAGFDVVVINRASRGYDVTTVFWSPGQAAGGRQVAATIDAARTEATPAEVRLSDSVDVHVVVGADRVNGT